MSLYTLPLNAPVSPLGVRREMDRLMNEVFGARSNGATGAVGPIVDAMEDATGFTLEMEIPGIAPEAVEVLAEDGALIVRGEKQVKERPEGVRMVLSERTHGAFERRFRLPKTADLNAIEATYAHGVLAIRVPKVAPAQPRRVQVTVEQSSSVGSGDAQQRVSSGDASQG